MKNLLNKKHEDGENGIAIVFSLIMLMVFFLIAFGFVSMATNAKLTSSVRIPAAQAALAGNETILNEALYAIDAELMNDGIINQTMLQTLNFANTTVNVDLQVWATKSTDNTTIAAALPLQLIDGDDFTPTSTLNLGWIKETATTHPRHDLNGDGFNDRYTWMVIPSDGIDANYVGETGTRTGDYAREMNINKLAATFSNVFIDWSDDDGSGNVSNFWDSKKDLITNLAAGDVDLAIACLEVNTTPVQITEMNNTARYDLSLDPSSDNIGDFMGRISWLNDSAVTERQEIAANIKDFIDADNIATAYTDASGKSVVGNERVPYLNQLILKVKNLTLDGTSGTASTTSLDITVTPELCNMFADVTSWGEGGTGAVDGSSATIVVEMDITLARGGVKQTASHTMSITYDLSTNTAIGYTQPSPKTAGNDTNTISIGSALASTNVLTDFTVDFTSITLLGSTDANDVWDKMSYNKTTSTVLFSAGSTNENSIEAANPRDNSGNATYPWLINGWNSVGTYSLGTKNSNYLTSTFQEGDTNAKQPWEWSTAYMPPAGKITDFAELGLCYRNKGYTLNFTDYNAKTPEVLGANLPGTLDLSDPDSAGAGSFNGGDRSLLDYVMISSPGSKVNSSSTVVRSYQQFGAINPNTTTEEVINLLLDNIKPLYGPDKATVLSVADIDAFTANFPGKENKGQGFKYEQFHQTDTDNFHNRNPSTYGYAFSTSHLTPRANTDISDALREAAVLSTMKLVTPKYSYFTVLCAVDLLDTAGVSLSSPTTIRAFVRLDNESGSFKILHKTQ